MLPPLVTFYIIPWPRRDVVSEFLKATLCDPWLALDIYVLSFQFTCRNVAGRKYILMYIHAHIHTLMDKWNVRAVLYILWFYLKHCIICHMVYHFGAYSSMSIAYATKNTSHNFLYFFNFKHLQFRQGKRFQSRVNHWMWFDICLCKIKKDVIFFVQDFPTADIITCI